MRVYYTTSHREEGVITSKGGDKEESQIPTSGGRDRQALGGAAARWPAAGCGEPDGSPLGR